nr:unnamed protein product [Digitaria exilis]
MRPSRGTQHKDQDPQAQPSKEPRGHNLDELKDLGKDLTSRCSGLPLAIVLLGGYLSKNRDIAKWKGLKSSVHWHGMIGPYNKILKAILDFSCYDMPSNLRWCFMYTTAFPEDSVIDVRALSRLWVAEGFMQPEINLWLWRSKGQERVSSTSGMWVIDANLELQQLSGEEATWCTSAGNVLASTVSPKAQGQLSSQNAVAVPLPMLTREQREQSFPVCTFDVPQGPRPILPNRSFKRAGMRSGHSVAESPIHRLLSAGKRDTNATRESKPLRLRGVLQRLILLRIAHFVHIPI